MQVAFRVDSSLQIGTGHLMRCLTLADALRERGASCHFVCRALEGNLSQLVTERGHRVHGLPAPIPNFAPKQPQQYAAWLGVDWEVDALETGQFLSEQHWDWLIVDHYALDFRWEQTLRSRVRKIMVIDDLADRRHDCDVLLDQTLGRNRTDYIDLLQPHAKLLIGPNYALLRPEFEAMREYSLQRRVVPELKSLLITMGGIDQHNVTGQILSALTICPLPSDISINVVLGLHAPWFEKIQAQAAGMPRPTRVLSRVSNMAQLMADSDLAIGAAGSTAWERCCLGLPSVLMVLAENQAFIAQALAKIGAAVQIRIEDLTSSLALSPLLQGDEVTLRKMSSIAWRVCNGKGASLVVGSVLGEKA